MIRYTIGKILQGVALLQVAYALWTGVQSGNAHAELTLLGAGVAVFVAGTLLQRGAGSGE